MPQFVGYSLAHDQTAFLDSSGPPSKGMMLPTVGWALLHQLTINTVPYGHICRPIWCGQSLKWDSFIDEFTLCQGNSLSYLRYCFVCTFPCVDLYVLVNHIVCVLTCHTKVLPGLQEFKWTEVLLSDNIGAEATFYYFSALWSDLPCVIFIVTYFFWELNLKGMWRPIS